MSPSIQKASVRRPLLVLTATASVPFLLAVSIGCAVATVLAAQSADAGGVGSTTPIAWPVLAFFVVVGAVSVRLLVGLRRQWQATVRLGRGLRHVRQQAPAVLVAAASGLVPPERMDYVDWDRPSVFTYGLIRPRVAVTSGFVRAVSPAQLRAALAHEQHHLAARDPLKIAFARAVSSAYPFMPAVRALRQRHLRRAELAADRAAIAECGVRAVAGALCKAAEAPGRLAGAAASFGGDALLVDRLRQLEDGAEPEPAPLPKRAVALTVASCLTLATAVVLPALALGGPVNVWGMAGHVQQQGQAAFACPMPVLAVAVAGWFCLGGVIARRQ